jgi:hypothetical protein
MAAPSVDDLARSFERYLRAGSTSPRTIETYLEVVRGFAAHLATLRPRPRPGPPRGDGGLDRGPSRPLEAGDRPQSRPRRAGHANPGTVVNLAAGLSPDVVEAKLEVVLVAGADWSAASSATRTWHAGNGRSSGALGVRMPART